MVCRQGLVRKLFEEEIISWYIKGKELRFIPVESWEGITHNQGHRHDQTVHIPKVEVGLV